MRLVFLLLALLFVAVGILFGALNPQSARVDFYWFALDGSLGAFLLISAFAGAVLGGVALLIGLVWPLQRSLRRARRDQARARLEPGVSVESPLAIGTDRP